MNDFNTNITGNRMLQGVPEISRVPAGLAVNEPAPMDYYTEGVPFEAVQPPPERMTNAGWQRFVNNPLRTWVTDQMIYVEQLVEYLNGLTPEKLTPAVQTQLEELPFRLEILAHDLKSPYLDNGSLSLLGNERLVSTGFNGSMLTVLRVHINMTLANKVDPSDKLGNAFKHVSLRWLQLRFGITNVATSSEGTAFIVSPVEEFQAQCSLSRFEREILLELRKPEIQKEFGFDPKLLAKFRPQAFGMFAQRTNNPARELISGQDQELIHAQAKGIIAGLEEFLRALAVGTTLAEKDPSSINLEGGRLLYNLSELPRYKGQPGFERWAESLRLGIGYVPSNRYGTSNALFDVHPRPAHDFGVLDHQPRNGSSGGYLQLLNNAILQASKARTVEEKTIAIDALHLTSNDFLYALELGEIAELEPRFPAGFVKWNQEIVLHSGARFTDYPFIKFLSSLPHKNVWVVMIELDSFKARLMVHPVDEADSAFWGIFEHFERVADDMGIPKDTIIWSRTERPVLLKTKYAGDKVLLVVPETDTEGRPVVIERYLAAVQESNLNDPTNEPFQDYAKIKVPNGVGINIVRTPLWVNPSTGEMLASKLKPEGFEPYMRRVTFTAVAKKLETPRVPLDVQGLFYTTDAQSDRIEALKELYAPQKAAIEVMAYSPLTGETLKMLTQPESIPLKDFKLEPMTSPIMEPGKYDGLMIFTPGSIPAGGDITTTENGMEIGPKYSEPLPRPEPMITPAEAPFPIVLPTSILGAAAVEAAVATTLPSIPSMAPMARPAFGVNGFGGSPLSILFIDSAMWVAASIVGATNESFFDFENKRYEDYMDNISRFMRYDRCKSNPTIECHKEFGTIWI